MVQQTQNKPRIFFLLVSDTNEPAMFSHLTEFLNKKIVK